ncbi:hypothetical protein GCM10011511_04430 [Puia dinghuensis]|uniref:Uncharacterized protein n=2 Tax=Puia dinghuensis TaxID=1792502 RepID=A0A8J2XNN3_9BACT|nr:hypothetical protein GCM10011511_04430 [Puia dinghuensis]
MMKHLTILLMLWVTTAMLSRVQAQSLINTNWKAYIAEPVYDTIVWHIRTDSSFVTGSNGTVLVRSVCKISGDTVLLNDYDGQFTCPDTPGRYKFARVEDMLNFTLIDDLCQGRATSITTAKWKKVPTP